MYAVGIVVHFSRGDLGSSFSSSASRAFLNRPSSSFVRCNFFFFEVLEPSVLLRLARSQAAPLTCHALPQIGKASTMMGLRRLLKTNHDTHRCVANIFLLFFIASSFFIAERNPSKARSSSADSPASRDLSTSSRRSSATLVLAWQRAEHRSSGLKCSPTCSRGCTRRVCNAAPGYAYGALAVKVCGHRKAKAPPFAPCFGTFK